MKILTVYNNVYKNNLIREVINNLISHTNNIISTTNFDHFEEGEIIKERLEELKVELEKIKIKKSAKALYKEKLGKVSKYNSETNKITIRKGSLFNHDNLIDSYPQIWNVVQTWIDTCNNKRGIEIREDYLMRLADICFIWLSLGKEKEIKELTNSAIKELESILNETTQIKSSRKHPNRKAPQTSSGWQRNVHGLIESLELDCLEKANIEIKNKVNEIFEISKNESLN